MCRSIIESARAARGGKTCSYECAKRRLQEKLGIGGYDGIPTGTVGALNELIASCDLMSKGFHVFRALSPSCPSDLIILRGEKSLRVQVRTGYISDSEKLTCPRNGEHDILAIVVKGKGVFYEPPFE